MREKHDEHRTNTEEVVDISWTNCEAIQRVYRYSRARGLTFSVLLALAAHVNPNGTAWPSIERLARLARTSTRTVKRAIKELEALGEITVLWQAAKNGVNLYRLDVARGGVNVTPEAVEAHSEAGGCQSDTRSERPLQATEAPGGVSQSRGGVTLAPENNKEKNKNIKPSPLPPSLDATSGPEKTTHPPTREDEEEALKISEKLSPQAEAVTKALGPVLASQLERLYREKAPASRYALWLEAALYPHLERLGRSLFRAVVEQNLPAAAGSGIRHPARFLEKKLAAEAAPAVPVNATAGAGSAAAPAPAPASEKRTPAGPVSIREIAKELESSLSEPVTETQPELERPAGEPSRDPRLRRLLTRRRQCPYGDHPRSDTCCLPRAIASLSLAVGTLIAIGKRPPHLRGEEWERNLALARDAYRKVIAEKDGIAGALTQLAEDDRERAEATLKALGLWAPLPKPEPQPLVADWALPLMAPVAGGSVAAAW